MKCGPLLPRQLTCVLAVVYLVYCLMARKKMGSVVWTRTAWSLPGDTQRPPGG